MDLPAAGVRNATLNAQEVRAWALDAGFTEAGLIQLPYAGVERDAARFEEWIAHGSAGKMHYLERRNEEGQLLRARVDTPFPWARSAIVLFALYNSTRVRSIDNVPTASAWIARYALSSKKGAAGHSVPSDYHKVLKKRLEKLEQRLHEELGEFEARSFVDTGPVVERSLATAAGLGWSAKNTCLIHPKLGSYGFLSVLLTSLEFTPKVETTKLLAADRCGTCRRCIEACPTAALTPYKMDTTRCISYLTIEHKGAIAEELMPAMGRQVFGCDICQEVCPWNRKAPLATDPDLALREELVNPSLDWLASLNEPDFETAFNGSPVRRAGFKGLRRNIAIAMGNCGVEEYAEILSEWALDEDEGLRSAAQWALGRLRR